jgi:hypothetical protein
MTYNFDLRRLRVRIALYLSLVLYSFASLEHQPELSTTMLIERDNGTWVLQIRSSLTAFEYEIQQSFGKDSFKTAEEFNALLLKHLMKNIAIEVNGVKGVSLQKGAVKLGHESVVKFEVSGIPKDINKLVFTNSSFKDIHENQSAFLVLKKGFSNKRFVLNNGNSHTVRLKVVSDHFDEE